MVAAGGLLLAATAALLSLSRPPESVYLQGDHVYVNGVALHHPAGNGGVVSGRLYEGPATLLIVPAGDGAVSASAVTFLDGEKVTGVCHLAPPSATEVVEACQLHMARTTVVCRDSMLLRAPGTWQRRCSDGIRLSITVPSGAAVIPMPFPMGWP
jgi:hypothetical protein